MNLAQVMTWSFFLLLMGVFFSPFAVGFPESAALSASLAKLPDSAVFLTYDCRVIAQALGEAKICLVNWWESTLCHVIAQALALVNTLPTARRNQFNPQYLIEDIAVQHM